MTSQMEPCLCPKCGLESIYEIVLSCNSFTPIKFFPNNKCVCGYQLQENDINFNKASNRYKNQKLSEKIYNKMNGNIEYKKWICEQCGSDNTDSCSAVSYGGEGHRDDIHAIQDTETCYDCHYVKNVTNISEYENDYYKFIGYRKDGFLLFQVLEGYREYLNGKRLLRNKKFEQTKQEMINSGELKEEEYNFESPKWYEYM